MYLGLLIIWVLVTVWRMDLGVFLCLFVVLLKYIWPLRPGLDYECTPAKHNHHQSCYDVSCYRVCHTVFNQYDQVVISQVDVHTVCIPWAGVVQQIPCYHSKRVVHLPSSLWLASYELSWLPHADGIKTWTVCLY